MVRIINSLRNLLGIIFSPSQTFRHLKENPNFIIPALIIISGMILITILLSSFVIEAGKDFKIEEIEPTGIIIMKSFSIIIVLILLIGNWLFKSLFLWFFIQLFNGKGKFNHILSITCYSAIIPFLKEILNLILICIKTPSKITNLSSLQFAYGLDIFFSSEKISQTLYTFLGKINFFSIWHMTVLIIGISIISEFNKTKSTFIVLFYWLFSTTIQIGIISLAGSLVKF
jgi:hypothetical protein